MKERSRNGEDGAGLRLALYHLFKVLLMETKIGRDRFIEMLTARFPEVAAGIDDCSRGLLHCEMATLKRATQSAIDNNDTEMVRRHFHFADEVFANAAPEVENAINVSYLENLRFNDSAKGLLTPRLRTALAELEEYLEKLFHPDRTAHS